ncbi:MAG: hypothetical protein ACLFVJ_22045 [Persicimonas sp.]
MSGFIRNTAPLYFSMLAIIAAGCSTAPDTRSADELAAGDRAELLEGVCPDTADRKGCTRCPDFLESDSSGPLRLERAVYGGFSEANADEALVEFSGCGGPHVVAMERSGDTWKRFGRQSKFTLQECQHVEREDGNIGLVCHLPAGTNNGRGGFIRQLGVNDGELQWRGLYHYDFSGAGECEHAVSNSKPRLRWRVDGVQSKVAIAREWPCLRTRPGQDLCAADASEVDRLTKINSKSVELDWSDMYGGKPIGDFCDRANIRDVALAQAPALEACLQEASDGARTANYVLQWKVSLDGSIMRDDHERPAVSITAGPEETPEVEACFRQALSNMQFDKPNGGICIVNFGYYFHEGEHWENACASFDPPPQEWLENR